MSYAIVIKRIYQAAEAADGARVLVDRLWPRGKSETGLALTEWYRDASPSPTLRRQYRQGDISAFVFAVRYRGELRDAPDKLLPLMRHARRGRLTLLTAARDLEGSHLPVLQEALIRALREEDTAEMATTSLAGDPPQRRGR